MYLLKKLQFWIYRSLQRTKSCWDIPVKFVTSVDIAAQLEIFYFESI